MIARQQRRGVRRQHAGHGRQGEGEGSRPAEQVGDLLRSAHGLDRAFDVLVKDVLAGKAEFWESHFLGLEQPYLQIEKLANLDQLPQPHGFTVMAFPYKIRGASAGWTRVVALVEVDD